MSDYIIAWSGSQDTAWAKAQQRPAPTLSQPSREPSHKARAVTRGGGDGRGPYGKVQPAVRSAFVHLRQATVLEVANYTGYTNQQVADAVGALRAIGEIESTTLRRQSGHTVYRWVGENSEDIRG